MAASTSTDGAGQTHVVEALKRFSRSIELCDDYLRGYYGLKIVSYNVCVYLFKPLIAVFLQASNKLLQESSTRNKKQQDDGFAAPDTKAIQRLNELATTKLAEIVRRYGAQEKLWQGYDAEEVAAARELLSKSSAQVVR